MLSEGSLLNSPAVRDEKLSEPRRQLPVGSAAPYHTLSTLHGDDPWPGAAYPPPGLPEAMPAAVSPMWPSGWVSSWEGWHAWPPESLGVDGWGAAAASEVPGSGQGEGQPPDDCGWALPPGMLSEECGTHGFVTGRKPRDTWSERSVASMLVKMADFKLVDHSHSGKLGSKGLGLFTVKKRHSDVPCEQELAMFNSFCSSALLYESPKVVRWASIAGKHESVQKLLVLGNALQKKQLASKFDGQVGLLIKHPYGSLVLQQLLYEVTQVVESASARTVGHLEGDMEGMVEAVMGAMQTELLDPGAFMASCVCMHGNHVIAILVDVLHKIPGQARFLELLVREVLAADNAVTMGKTRFGCRVLQRLVDTPDRHLVEFLLSSDIFAQLATHEFGNYVVQAILDSTHDNHTDAKLAALQSIVDNFGMQGVGDFVNPPRRGSVHSCFYLMDPYAHHVVRKCLEMPSHTCGGWACLRHQLVELVLDADTGMPKYQFVCERMSDMLAVLKHGTAAPSRASSKKVPTKRNSW